MAYAQNTITSANAANDFVTVLDGLLIAEGWTVVETLTPSGNFRNRVYKSDGASNLCGYDWYLGVCWTTVGTANFVRVFGFESYNAGTHVASGISGVISPIDQPTSAIRTSQPVTGYLSTTTINMSSLAVTSSATTLAGLAGASGATNTSVFGFQTLLDSSAFGYWMSVTLDHVALWTTVAANRNDAVISSLVRDADYLASGIYNHTPIVTWNTQGFMMSSNIIGVTPTSTAWTAAVFGASGVIGAKLPALTDSYLPAYAWQPYVYLTYLNQGSANATPTTAMVGLVPVGQVPDFLMVYGGSVGDTITVSGVTYVLTPPLVGSSTANINPTLALLVEP
jgi:hypothetical protein